MSEAKEKMIVFDGSNYDEWKTTLVTHLMINDAYMPIVDKRPIELTQTNATGGTQTKVGVKTRSQEKDKGVSKETSVQTEEQVVPTGLELKRRWDLMQKWDSQDMKARGIIRTSVHPRYLTKIELLTSAK